MDVEYYYEFAALAHRLNFRETAAELNISQSALSRHVAALEQYYGLPLFNRDRHQVHLTEAGAFLLDYAESICDLAHQSREHIQRLFGGENRVRISGVIGHPSLYPWVWRVERRLQEATPPISIHVERNASPLLEAQVEELRAGSTDCALLFSADSQMQLDGDVEAIPIGRVPMSIIVLKDHPLAAQPLVSAPMLEGCRFVQFTGPDFSPHWRTFVELLTRAGVSYTTAPIPAATEYDVIRSVDAMGKGVYITPRPSVLPAIWQNPRTAVIPLDEEAFFLNLMLLFRKGQKEQLVRLAATCLSETFPEFLAEQAASTA